jgi:hypothetical protein
MLHKLLIVATVALGLAVSACIPDDSNAQVFAGGTEEFLKNWLVSEGDANPVPSWNDDDMAIALMSDRTVITRRLERLSADDDAVYPDASLNEQFFPPFIKIVAQKEDQVSLTLVVEEFELAQTDAGAQIDTDGSAITPVSKVFPEDTVAVSQFTRLIQVGTDWQYTKVELPELPYDPTIPGYQVHISILKEGAGLAVIHSADF